MKHMSFDTYIDRTPKKLVVAFLRDRVTSRVHMEMSKRKIRHLLSAYDLLKVAEKELNNLRNMPIRFRVDFQKYRIG